MKTSKLFLLLSLIFVIGLFLRLFGIDWDQGQHLHPDERFLTMVTNDIRLPSGIYQYFNSQNSPLNPFNHPDYQFFVYGTFPIFLNKLTSFVIRQDTYDGITQTGRFLSALFDSFNIFLLFFLARKFLKNRFISLLPSLVYAFTVLPLQLSHFYAVDTFLNFFILAAFTALVFNSFYLAAFLFGLALASKVSALLFVPVIGLFFLCQLKSQKLLSLLATALFCLLIAFITFRIFQPYAFDGAVSLNPKFIDSLRTLSAYNRPDIYFPPAVQWISKTKFIFPFTNIALWGLGLPFTLLFLSSTLLYLSKTKAKLLKDPQNQLLAIILFWIILLFLYQSSQFTYAMRYFLPIYPLIILLSVILVSHLKFHPKLIIGFTLIHLIGGLAFLNIYALPHSRVQASLYIYNRIPQGSVITNEYWDDPLPLYLPGFDPNVYQGNMLPLYDPDTPEKWSALWPQIDSADYLIMSSNRLWGSIPKVPHLYPQTSEFYQNLFDGRLPFQKQAHFNTYPGFSLPLLGKCLLLGPTDYPSQNNRRNWLSWENCSYPGIYFRDDTADESFTVYDHPKVLIFSAVKNR